MYGILVTYQFYVQNISNVTNNPWFTNIPCSRAYDFFEFSFLCRVSNSSLQSINGGPLIHHIYYTIEFLIKSCSNIHTLCLRVIWTVLGVQGLIFQGPYFQRSYILNTIVSVRNHGTFTDVTLHIAIDYRHSKTNKSFFLKDEVTWRQNSSAFEILIACLMAIDLNVEERVRKFNTQYLWPLDKDSWNILAKSVQNNIVLDLWDLWSKWDSSILPLVSLLFSIKVAWCCGQSWKWHMFWKLHVMGSADCINYVGLVKTL